MSEQGHIVRPVPRRAFEITPVSTDSSTPPTPSPENINAELLESKLNGDPPPNRTRSLLNLTSSTLFGIYSPTTTDNEPGDSATPWGTGAQTPSFRKSGEGQRPCDLAALEKSTNTEALHPRHISTFDLLSSLFIRTVLLFGFGVAYGTVITHLHESEQVAPVKVGGINIDSWLYIIFWGVSGVALGNLLPWIDRKVEDLIAAEGSTQIDEGPEDDTHKRDTRTKEPSISEPPASSLGPDWNPAVRGVGAFVGIAFAIRRLQWQSTMQASLTLALVNPCLWYTIDRTQAGFWLSAAVGIFGTVALLLVNPAVVPRPTTSSTRSVLAAELSQKFGKENLITDESIAVATWIASVLFCSSVCFGNIGRRMAKDRRASTAA